MYSILRSRSLENPTTQDVMRLKRVPLYIAGTIDLVVTYCSNFKKGINKLCQKQVMVATSTIEAEIVAANQASKEIIWLIRL